MGNTLMLVFTGIIASATIVYTIFSVMLWKTTKQAADAAKASADAARVSADAAKKSADVDAALHRPYLGVSVLQRQNDYNADDWSIWCRVKNYGTLPACEVAGNIDIDRGGRGQYGAGPLCSGCEILPVADLDRFLQIHVDRQTRDQLSSGGWSMVAHVEIRYFGLAGTRYTHKANFAYDRTTQNFKLEGSETKAENP